MTGREEGRDGHIVVFEAIGQNDDMPYNWNPDPHRNPKTALVTSAMFL